jgi:hypothetical protein
MRSAAIAVLILVMSPLLALAQGGPPLITDDPGTPGPGRWEINLAFTTEKGHGETRFETPLLDVNYGWGERHQFKLEIPWVVLSERGEETKNGLGNTRLGWKWRFLDEKESGISVSMYPQLEFNNPGSSSADRGIAEKGTQLLLPLQAAKGFGPFGVNVELGYTIRDSSDDELIYGVAFSYEVSDRMELLGELFGTSVVNLKEHQLLFDLGTRYKLTDHYVLLFSAGRDIESTGVNETQFRSYLGIQFLF